MSCNYLANSSGKSSDEQGRSCQEHEAAMEASRAGALSGPLSLRQSPLLPLLSSDSGAAALSTQWTAAETLQPLEARHAKCSEERLVG